MSKQRHLLLIVGFLTMAAGAGIGQVSTCVASAPPSPVPTALVELYGLPAECGSGLLLSLATNIGVTSDIELVQLNDASSTAHERRH